jgi:ankyrin repeat protein
MWLFEGFGYKNPLTGGQKKEDTMLRLQLFVVLISLCVSLSACNRPALLTTAAKGQTSKVNELLAQGVDINMRDSQNWTPLMVASFNGRIETVKALLAKGADVNLKGEDDLTALKLAKGRGHTTIVKLLKGAGAK